ncbi:uncharacterized protein [Triticum aestivum]|uniref:uncharacterized protein n=1 Tax=Triticum aestivum TaxID=4565 RepID=UPI00098BAD93|nr:uncharacterized protein LOC123165982 [Triticum aestivum]XP_045086621.1 uncharacterized protein LOC109742237 [Aegilops tauschii subsp. strangulata]
MDFARRRRTTKPPPAPPTCHQRDGARATRASVRRAEALGGSRNPSTASPAPPWPRCLKHCGMATHGARRQSGKMQPGCRRLLLARLLALLALLLLIVGVHGRIGGGCGSRKEPKRLHRSAPSRVSRLWIAAGLTPKHMPTPMASQDVVYRSTIVDFVSVWYKRDMKVTIFSLLTEC